MVGQQPAGVGQGLGELPGGAPLDQSRWAVPVRSQAELAGGDQPRARRRRWGRRGRSGYSWAAPRGGGRETERSAYRTVPSPGPAQRRPEPTRSIGHEPTRPSASQRAAATAAKTAVGPVDRWPGRGRDRRPPRPAAWPGPAGCRTTAWSGRVPSRRRRRRCPRNVPNPRPGGRRRCSTNAVPPGRGPPQRPPSHGSSRRPCTGPPPGRRRARPPRRERPGGSPARGRRGPGPRRPARRPRPTPRPAGRGRPEARPPAPARAGGRAPPWMPAGGPRPTAPRRHRRPAPRPAGPRSRRGRSHRPPAVVWRPGGPRPPGTTGPGPGGRTRSASRRASSATGECSLPPKAPPLPYGRGRRLARPAPRGVGLHVGRLDPGGPEGEVPLARRQLDGVVERQAGAPALHLAGPGPGLTRATRPPRSHPGRRAPPPGRPGRAGVVGEPGVAEHHGRTHPLGHPALDGGPGLGPVEVGGRSGLAGPASGRGEDPFGGLLDGLPPGAAAQVGHQGLVDLRRSGRRAPGGARAARRITIPGVQNPHWLPPVATRASDHSRRVSSGRPSRVVTSRPASRRTGVTHATRGAPSTQTVQQPHWPWGLQPSLTETIPSCSRRTSSSDAPSSATSTSAPSTRSRISVSADQLKEEPQPQVREALGLVTWNPAPWSPSL